ncbi:MAG: DNA-binding protein [Synergistaceae bacterium]|jgi:predicted DNA-binding protein with PD1-like motif|nr:DNA-binding protein [Synergistaceae bacterium]
MSRHESVVLPEWQQDAKFPAQYHCCEARRGREFIVRMTTGADPVLAIENFAKEQHIRFGKVHATFMDAFQPCKYFIWAPDYNDPDNWHREAVCVNHNLSMLGAIGGMIGQRPTKSGGEEPFVAMHFVAGGAWDTVTFSGHMVEGTVIKGCMQVFVTELLDIEALPPVDVFEEGYTFPENFYRNVAQK